MGYMAQRQAAARTVLRAQLTGDRRIIEDAENSVSAFLEGDDLEEYLQEHFPTGLPAEDPGLVVPTTARWFLAEVVDLPALRELREYLAANASKAKENDDATTAALFKRRWSAVHKIVGFMNTHESEGGAR